MRVLSISCPKCRQALSVRIRDLDVQQACSRCKCSFHINSGGKCVIGPRPRASSTSAFSPIPEANRGPDLLEKLAELPRPVKFGALAAAAIGLALCLASVLHLGQATLPDSLDDRTVHASRSFLRGDRESLIKLCDPANAISLERWLEQRRPPLRPEWAQAESAEIAVRTLVKETSDRMACTLAIITFPTLPETEAEIAAVPGSSRGSRSKAKGPARKTMELVFWWRLDPSGLWIIDGGRTLKETPR
jgi:hypothetical protein